MKLKNYKLSIPIYPRGDAGNLKLINPEEFLGLIKGLAKAGTITFDLPDEFQQHKKHFIQIEISVSGSTLNWQKQLESYGIKVVEQQ